MSPFAPLPVISVVGTHREVGRQMGEATRDMIRTDVELVWADVPAGRSREAQLALAQRFRDAAAPSLPWLIEELDGCAEGAGVDALELFAATV